MALYANGQIPLTIMDTVPAANGQKAYLLPLVAASFNRVAERARGIGFNLMATSAGDGFRSYDRQVAVFRQRYRAQGSGGGPFGDVRWWNGTRYVRITGAAAAVPGTSNHGKGITVDISGIGGYGSRWYTALRPLLEAEGWSNAEGRTVGEPWHWNQTRTAYQVLDTNQPVPVDDGRPRNNDGSLRLDQDGVEGKATIMRWQEVMGTPIDGVIDKKSTLIKADQTFLNVAVGSHHIPNLGKMIGVRPKAFLDVDGDRGKYTDITRQFWLYNAVGKQHQINLLGHHLQFDGEWGAESTKVFQFALNQAVRGSKTYGRVA